jgi:hypothetical protein
MKLAVVAFWVERWACVPSCTSDWKEIMIGNRKQQPNQGIPILKPNLRSRVKYSILLGSS